MTNFERIKQMNVEEFVEFIDTNFIGKCVICASKFCCGSDGSDNDYCKSRCVIWMNSEEEVYDEL